MEANTGFDLNVSMAQWRESLRAAGVVGLDNIEELELHLKDSISKLESLGLSTEEAFFVAQRRLGGGAQLADEFAKINHSQIWISRVIWMLAGFIFFQWIGWMTGFASNQLLLLVFKRTNDLFWLGAICAAAYWVGTLSLCYLAWQLVSRGKRLWNWAAEKSLNHPVLLGACLIVFSWG